MTAYYNEIDPYAAQWLRNLINADLIPAGAVDERSIREVTADDLRGFTQCHFFAGIGGWPYAARLAGWPDNKPIWTGSCPCQPFSQAGRRGGTGDARHLWPDFFRLISAARPPVIMGEQVAGTLGYGWFDGVRANLAGENYASRAIDFPACAVDAPHIRNRIYWVAKAMDNAASARRDAGRSGTLAPLRDGTRGGEPKRRNDDGGGTLADPHVSQRDGRPIESKREPQRRTVVGRPIEGRGMEHAASTHEGRGRLRGPGESGGPACERAPDKYARSDLRNGTFWSGADWIVCHDGKARRTEPGLCLMADGIPARISKWRAAGNSIVPQAAYEVIAAYLDTEGEP